MHLLSLDSHTTLLIDLRYTIHWFSPSGSGRLHSQPFPALTFAASIVTDAGPEPFLRSLDRACLERIRAVTRYTPYRFGPGMPTGEAKCERVPGQLPPPVRVEARRGFVWNGVDDEMDLGREKIARGTETRGVVSIAGLSTAELEEHLEMMRKRGYRDWVRVEMAVEIEPGDELYGKRASLDWRLGGAKWPEWDGQVGQGEARD
ncbi:uncharacterized protein CTHT_0021270 [Thermochaetoides thermophila DSM 1495]|uniref:Uncharacterized protein n=1 Tax=Chaetomium thermophilum (strain DSM 1495 / CBS 144.50 / IMI 039719) TaxID=759272 RepID=G0S8C7_CHATD|nr:hypothetical protein CTHT_0021270 [Thermochaetoides thermophila DSM 1495]EGS20302.1 hypothetical protein CTHT_0021270 [Thermochaetoides thermophila DSM 1495]